MLGVCLLAIVVVSADLITKIKDTSETSVKPKTGIRNLYPRQRGNRSSMLEMALPNIIQSVRSPSTQMKQNQKRTTRAASPAEGSIKMQHLFPETPAGQQPEDLQKSSSSPGLAPNPTSSSGGKKMGFKKLKSIARNRIKSSRRGGAGDASVVSGEGTDGTDSVGGDPVGGAAGRSISPSVPSPPLPPQSPMATRRNPRGAIDEEKGSGDARETIDGGGGGKASIKLGSTPSGTNKDTRSNAQVKSRASNNSGPGAVCSSATNITANSTDVSGRTTPPAQYLPSARTRSGAHSPSGLTAARSRSNVNDATATATRVPSIAVPDDDPAPPELTPAFQFISDDNFTRRVDAYDGQVITCSDSGLPTYEVGNYLGGGVAGVVYEGKRLRPVHEYPPVRVRGGGAFYPDNVAPPLSPVPAPGSPVTMTMTSSSFSSNVRRNRSWTSAAKGPNDTAETGTGLFADVYRAVVPRRMPEEQASPRRGEDGIVQQAAAANGRRRTGGRGGEGDDPLNTSSDGAGCTSFLFGNCGFDRNVDDRSAPLAASAPAPPPHTGGLSGAAPAGGSATPAAKERYQAVDMASIEVPAAFSSMEQEATHQVVVDDADAPNRSRREARALLRNSVGAALQVASPLEQGYMSDRKKANSFVYDSCDETLSGTHLIEDMSETVAIKILNPVGFRLLDPATLHKAVIVREGTLPVVNPADGSFTLTEENVWWLVNPNSRNLRSLLRKNHSAASHVSSLHTSKGADDASEESSLKRQHSSLPHSLTGGVDRGSPERGLRLSLVATYVDPGTNALWELPLPRCVEIWGHPPFAATDKEFEAMMEALLRLNAGGNGGALRRPGGRNDGRRSEAATRVPSPGPPAAGEDPLAHRRSGSTVFCPALSAYIAVPAVPPKYLRWLKQRRLATKEVRNMMRIGRHKNVVHLYEVLEMVQDSKSTMFLILELVRGGELFDLISSNSSSKRKKAAATENELHEVTMRKFFSELASGINFIHSCGVAHRDLKPEVSFFL